MSTTLELIEDIKTTTGAASDYAVAKKLGVSRQAISLTRKHGTQFSMMTTIKAAKLLNKSPVSLWFKIKTEQNTSTEDLDVIKEFEKSLKAIDLLHNQEVKEALDRVSKGKVSPADAKLMREICILCKIENIPNKHQKH